MHDLPEIMGGGLGLFDADGDGDLDVYLAQGGPIVPGAGLIDRPCPLYLNDGDGRFRDAGDRGCPGPSYAMGVAVVDYDRDGRDDLFVTGYRDQRLYRNRGDGRFEDATKAAGLESDLWSTSAAWADLDGDGDLDLFVAGYLDYDPALAPFCAAPDGKRDYCGPEDFPAQPDRLYRNNGDGTFRDVTEGSGLNPKEGRGLGVLVAQLVGDPRPDIFVANDGTACWLFENLGGMKFREVGVESGVAVDGKGQALAGMGVGLGDLDADGHPDLVVSNFLGRSTIAFRGIGPGQFADDSEALGMSPTRGVNGFGLAVMDLDSDGRDDLLQSNGHVLARSRLGTPFAMPLTYLLGGGGRLSQGTLPASATLPRLGRGLVVGDLDGDGRPDAIVASLDRPPLVLSAIDSPNRWLAIDLVDRSGAAPLPICAQVRVQQGGRVQARQVTGGGSYLSASARTLWFGLGRATRAERVEVRWPDGFAEAWEQVEAKPRTTLKRGTGRATQ